MPVPGEILRRGPDDRQSLAWLWAHWGTTRELRHVTRENAAGQDRRGRPTDAGTGCRHLSFLVALARAGTDRHALADAALRSATQLRGSVPDATDLAPAPDPGLSDEMSNWEDPPRVARTDTAPVLSVDGFAGPLD